MRWPPRYHTHHWSANHQGQTVTVHYTGYLPDGDTFGSGMGEEADMRRGGTWYLGVQALEEFAQYSLTTTYRTPSVEHEGGCGRLDRFCQMPDRYLTIEKSRAARRGALMLAPWMVSLVVLTAAVEVTSCGQHFRTHHLQEPR